MPSFDTKHIARAHHLLFLPRGFCRSAHTSNFGYQVRDGFGAEAQRGSVDIRLKITIQWLRRGSLDPISVGSQWTLRPAKMDIRTIMDVHANSRVRQAYKCGWAGAQQDAGTESYTARSGRGSVDGLVG